MVARTTPVRQHRAMSQFAALFRARYPDLTGFLDEDETNGQANLVRANGLDVLNERVLASPRAGVLDFVAEHNMAAMLLRQGFTDMAYEPPSMQRPVDLTGLRAGRSYRVEVKRLAASEHDKLQSTTMHTINRALESNTGSIVIQMQLRESFEAADINGLIRHVKEALRQPRMEEAYVFAADEEPVAWYKFHLGSKATPYVGILGDMGVLRDVTGVEASRVQSKVKRAYGKFKACPEDDAIHLLALEVDSTIDLAHIAEALYGREYATFTRQGYAGSGRHPGGAFSRGQYSRLGGVLIARRAGRYRLFVPYNFTLFTNPGGMRSVDNVAEALGVGEVLGSNDFP